MALKFTYSPLTSADSFRLLVLEPGRRSEEVQCRIYNTTHSARPVYDALSYTWGREEDEHTCRISDVVITIRRNLYHALRDLRSPYNAKTLWIDALCIDQASIEERNHQVGQMSAIYSHAAMVRIYLGRASPTSSLAINWIEQFCTRNCSPDGIMYGSLPRSSLQCMVQKQVDCWQALRLLCERKYWRRLWIVQEVILAERLHVHCGRDETPWEGLDKLLDGFDRLFKPKAARQAATQIRRGMLMKLRNLKTMHRTLGCPLDVLLQATRNSLCSDPRDKVYGLLGLADDVRADRIEINYASKTGDAYSDMLAILWKFFIKDPGPELAVKGCKMLSTKFVADSKHSWTSVWGPVIYSEESDIIGRSCGRIIHVGAPWEGGLEMQGWTDGLAYLSGQGVNVEEQYLLFCSILHTASAGNEFHKVGNFHGDRNASTLSNLSSLEKEPSSIRFSDTVRSVDRDSDQETRAEHFRRLTTDQYKGFDLQHLRNNDLRFFLGSQGQMGLVSDYIRHGDDLCQFKDCDVTAIVRRDSVSADWNLVGKAIMTPQPAGGVRGSSEESGERRGGLPNRIVAAAPLQDQNRPENLVSGGGVEILATEMDDNTVQLQVSASTLAWLTSWYPVA